MGYIGVDINYGNIAKQVATSSGSTTPTGALTYTVPTSESIMVMLDGVTQVPGTDYNVTGGTVLTFTTSVPADVVVLVYFLGRSLDIGTPGSSTVDSGQIVSGAVDLAHMSANSVDSSQLTAGSVDLAHMSSQSVDEDNLHISNAGSNGQFLSKQSGDAGGLTWATQSSGGPSYGSGDEWIRYNDDEINANITIAAGKNASSVGPITIGSSYAITVNGVYTVI